MKAMIIGSGAREHALAWKFSRSKRISGLYALPGNAGTAEVATNIEGSSAESPDEVVGAARDHRIDLVVIGPETSLEAGVVDALREAGVATVGPDRHAATLESSKAAAKSFMAAYDIPTAAWRTFSDIAQATGYLEGLEAPVVVKKSGLAAGKGVLESDDTATQVAFAAAVIEGGDQVVVEERLTGYEVSVFGLSDGKDHLLLPACTDYKKAGAGGTGPNTGGMGALCPVPWLSSEDEQRIRREIVEPTYRGLTDAGMGYAGVLYFGIMVTENGPRVLEYNVRLGDPEAQVVIPLIQSDLVDVCEALVGGRVEGLSLRISPKSAVGVVVAAPGYPSNYPTGLEVRGLPAPAPDLLVFHASTRRMGDQLMTGGGRCFTVVARGPELLTARTRAYAAAREVVFEGSWFRPDIGGRIFGN